MRMKLREDERWPVYSLEEFEPDDDMYHAAAVEIPSKLLTQYKRAVKAWEDIQEKLGKLADEIGI